MAFQEPLAAFCGPAACSAAAPFLNNFLYSCGARNINIASVKFLSSNNHVSSCIMLLQVSLGLEVKNHKKLTRIDG